MSPRAYFAALAALVLVACDNDNMAELEEYVRQVKGRKPGPIAPLPVIEPIAGVSFAPGNRRDPFVPERRDVAPVTAPVDDGLVPDPSRRQETLEQFPLDALAMVGTLTQGGCHPGLDQDARSAPVPCDRR